MKIQKDLKTKLKILSELSTEVPLSKEIIIC
jgi:hypothetical protein